MDQILPNGELVVSRGKTTYKVLKKLKEGGQAEIYLVESDNKNYVLKVYFEHQATENQRKILVNLLGLNPPSRCFIWPIDLVELKKYHTFGYIMDYVDTKSYSTLEDLLYDDEETDVKLYRDIIAAYLLSDSFFRLHIRGLIHADISSGNVWINKITGDIKISDCDNIIFSNQQSDIGGTLPFKAPEVILQELDAGRAQLSADTDRHSLAVALFMILFHHHPFEGQKENEYGVINQATMIEMYGKNPIFIYDPKNTENRPDPDTQAVVEFFWERYPQFTKDLFIESFTSGIKNPKTGRVRETIWRKKILKLRDSIVRCPACGNDNFFDVENSEKKIPANYICWACEKTQKVPQKLTINGSGISHTIYLNENMFLYKTHIDNSYTIETKIGKIESTMIKDKKFFGIRNVSSEKWHFSFADNVVKELSPGKAIIAAENIRIRFPGGISGTFTS
jgi:eukaryotic-like serine/threonine-protein kinase